ncbi:MAG: GNAT family N-acetyltransferase [Alphaproteobacteria bacterium]|nr:GNAT family N-acetyltransferase [Alphaproteobacteria bacterium]
MTTVTDNENSSEMRLGTLEVRLAREEAEIKAAQLLRYRVFYEEMQAVASPEIAAARRDFDALDDYCDHLLVLDTALPEAERIVGTYRLIRRSAAKRFGKFYSSDEYDISCLINFPGEVLELGRSCVAADYRTRSTMQLLWNGLAAYVFQHDIALMFGCASLPGCDPQVHKEALSYLYYHHLAPPGLRPKALPERYVDMRLMPPESVSAEGGIEKVKVDPRLGGSNLPPLIKGYLRVGAYVGDGAVIDHQFNTTDVCIIVKTDLMADRYMKHFERRSRGSTV